jgi:Outer membrane protein beta-barrel domain
MNKKMIIAAIAGIMTGTAYGQSIVKETGRTSFGIRAGVNFQNINGKDAAGNSLKNDLLTGFNAGINAEVPLSSGFYLQPGALYSAKGAKWANGSKVKLSYIEVPVNFVYKPVLGSGNMLLGFGPYVGFGINGKVESPNGSSEDVKFTKDYDATSAAPQFKRFDAGGNLLAGYEFANNVSFQLNAQLGLADINPKTTAANDKTKLNNTGFGLSLGYRF